MTAMGWSGVALGARALPGLRRSWTGANAWLSVLLGVLVLAAPPAAQAQETLDSLRLEAGDAVRLEFMADDLPSGEYRVAFDGLVLLPRVGFVQVEGRTFREVEQEIRAAYSLRLPGGEPVLRVTPLVRVLVMGQVRQPGISTVDPTFGMIDVLSAAGGLAPAADRGKISLVRDGRIIARLDPGSRRLATRFRSGDQIVVGRIGWFRENFAIFVGALGSIGAAAVAGWILR